MFRGAGLRREHRTAENDITDTADTLAWCSTDTAILLLILTVGETQLITADNDIFTDYVLGLLTRCHWRRAVGNVTVAACHVSLGHTVTVTSRGGVRCLTVQSRPSFSVSPP